MRRTYHPENVQTWVDLPLLQQQFPHKPASYTDGGVLGLFEWQGSYYPPIAVTSANDGPAVKIEASGLIMPGGEYGVWQAPEDKGVLEAIITRAIDDFNTSPDSLKATPVVQVGPKLAVHMWAHQLLPGIVIDEHDANINLAGRFVDFRGVPIPGNETGTFVLRVMQHGISGLEAIAAPQPVTPAPEPIAGHQPDITVPEPVAIPTLDKLNFL